MHLRGSFGGHDENDFGGESDAGDIDDDEPPNLSSTPQEFLHRMQQQQGGHGGSSLPAAAPSSYPSGGRRPQAKRPSAAPFGSKRASPSKDAAVTYVCSSCGAEYIKWMGKCSSCGEWNTIQEHRTSKTSGSAKARNTFAPSSFRGSDKPSSWLDGIGFDDHGGGGPVRVTDVYRDALSPDGPGGSRGAGGDNRRLIVPDDSEINSVLGGGIVPGSLTLLGGDPGVGKSTLLLQTAGSAAALSDRTPIRPGIGMGPPVVKAEEPDGSNEEGQISQPSRKRRGLGPVLYVSGEESADQIAMRASRLGIDDPELLLWCETDADRIAEMIADSVHAAASSFGYGAPDPFYDETGEAGNANSPVSPARPPSLVVVDSIQTMLCDSAGSSSAGGITQVRECVGLFLRLAKSTGVPVVLVGHVTKSGDVAGPRTVEHMVDCVLYLEGCGPTGEGGGGGGAGTTSSTRILRAAKNRFGSSEEVGVYEMSRGGRLVPITDPSSYFLSTRRDTVDSEGCAVSVVLEGVRSMTVEVQALVAWSAGSGGYSGRRIADGVSNSRLLLILAVLQKRYGISFRRQDVYVNVVGGMRLGGVGSRSGSSGSDLAVAVALVSSLVGIPVRSDTAFVGEVGLLGEVRPV